MNGLRGIPLKCVMTVSGTWTDRRKHVKDRPTEPSSSVTRNGSATLNTHRKLSRNHSKTSVNPDRLTSL